MSLIFTFSAALLFFPGEKNASAQAALLRSHAYLYASDGNCPSDHSCPVHYVEVVIYQGKSIRYLGCNGVDESALPHHPGDLATLVNGTRCTGLFEGVGQTLSRDAISRLIYQRRDHRFIYSSASVNWERNSWNPQSNTITSGGFTVLIDPSDRETLKMILAQIEYTEGKNPTVFTDRMTELRAYDAVIDYPEITERPAEQ